MNETWLDYSEHKPPMDHLNGKMSSWFIVLPTVGGAPIMCRIIKGEGEILRIIYRDASILDLEPEHVIRKWLPIPPDENGKIF